MQTVGLAPGLCEYTFEVKAEEQERVETVLGKLCAVKAAALVNFHQYHSQSSSDTRTYVTVADSVAERLSDRSLKRQQGYSVSISSLQLSRLAISCIQSLAISQETVPVI